MAEFRLYRMTWPEIEKDLPNTAAVLVPIGATEQHGLHVPLDNDTFTSLALCERVAAEAEGRGLRVLVAPPLYYGVSWYHMDFPGTIRLDVRTFTDVILQICDSLRKHGFRNIFLFNSHGGNNAALSMAINIAYEQWRERVYLVHWGDLAGDVTGTIGGPKIHIEEVETSLALALGQRVDMEMARRDAFDRREALKALGQPTSKFINYDASHRGPSIGMAMNYVREISPSGVIGDATRANKETGDEIIKAVVGRLADAIAELNQK